MRARLFVPAILPVLVALGLTAPCPASPALAATTPPGMNLRWDKCYDDGGVENKVFACNTNIGLETLVLSFVLDTPMADVSGFETWLELVSTSANPPDWWQFKNAGTCRVSALSMNTAIDPLAVNCADWSNGLAVGGIGSYQVGFFGPNTVRFGAAIAVPPNSLATLVAGQEYFVANLRINHTKTVGLGACAGCDVPVCIVFSQLRITTPVPPNNRSLVNGANGVASQLATWQSGVVVNPHLGFSTNLGGNYATMDGCSTLPTGTRHSTWGTIKSLYR